MPARKDSPSQLELRLLKSVSENQLTQYEALQAVLQLRANTKLLVRKERFPAGASSLKPYQHIYTPQPQSPMSYERSMFPNLSLPLAYTCRNRILGAVVEGVIILFVSLHFKFLSEGGSVCNYQDTRNRLSIWLSAPTTGMCVGNKISRLTMTMLV